MSNKHSVILKRFQKELNALNTTHERIAQYLKCDTSTVTKHYSGKLGISVNYLYKYSILFGVSSDYLLGLSHSKSRESPALSECIGTVLVSNQALITTITNNQKELMSVLSKII